jgi:hypothetical protein
VPPEVSLAEESSRRARSRRRFAGFPRRYRVTPPPNSSPSAILRPSRPHRRVPGEFSVRPDLFPRLAVRRSAAPPWSLAGDRHGCGRSDHHASVACWWASGPIGQRPWVKWPRVQKVSTAISISEKLLKMFETCKNHRIFSVYRKNANDLSKCS